MSAWQKHDADELDTIAWNAISHWHKKVDFEPVFDGLDYAVLSRFFLWDKVGRAIRYARFSCQRDFEESVYLPGVNPVQWPWHPRLTESPDSISRLKKARSFVGTVLHETGLRPKPRIVVFLPYPNTRINKLVNVLSMDNRIQVAVSDLCLQDFPGARPLNHEVQARAPAKAFLNELYASIIQGLSAFDVQLVDSDISVLREQLGQLQQIVATQEAIIPALRPDLVLVHSDNHPPYQAAVLVARKHRVRTAMLQHGLDCEHHYLEEAYASAIAVWGEARKTRYETRSEYQPGRIEITGNPAWDGMEKAPLKVNPAGAWLWVTRPHVSHKCYSPSRLPDEGLDILSALCAVLRKTGNKQELIIKTHPFDYKQIYQNFVDELGLSEQVIFSDQHLGDLLQSANVVISEDSTAGMEAMLSGKFLIHSHFAGSKPTMPFVEFDAAYKGFNEKQLEESLMSVSRLSASEIGVMDAGQKRFLEQYAGPLDSGASDRFKRFIMQVTSRTTISPGFLKWPN